MTKLGSKRHDTRNLLIGVACLASSSAFAAPNLLSNGSFESPVLPPGSDFLVAPVGGSVIPGWSVVGAAGQNVAIIEALYNLPDAAGINFTAADGVQWIDMAGAGINSTEGVLQSVSLPAGTYSLSFSIGNVVAAAAGLGTTSKANLLINGIFAQSFINGGSIAGAVSWQQFAYTFSAGGVTTIEFRNGDGPSDNLNGFDNVVLSAVPEPATAVSLILGLFFLLAAPGGVIRSRFKE